MENNTDVAAARRKFISEQLRTGQAVTISPTGVVQTEGESTLEGSAGIKPPVAKLAGRNYYWYQSDPSLYEEEVAMMQRFFPSFKIGQLTDGSGRLYWRGTVQPAGEDGIVWDLMLIYKNTHPEAEGYGGSIQILPISPRLKDIAEQLEPSLLAEYGSYDRVAEAGLGLGLPHIYRDMFGREEEYFICSADPKYFIASQTETQVKINYMNTSAASALSWACKWCLLCQMWLDGEIGDELALEGIY